MESTNEEYEKIDGGTRKHTKMNHLWENSIVT